MKRRIIKEFRPLLLPFCIALAAASCVALFNYIERAVISESVGFFLGLSSFALFATLVLMAALSFGTEYQQGTLPLLLSQPVERFRLWKEKMLVEFGAMAAITMSLLLVHEALKLPAGRDLLVAIGANLWPGHEIIAGGHSELDDFGYWILAGTFLLATLCSAGFWTLTARSTIGGAVFTVASQSIPLLVLTAALEKLGVPDPAQITVIEIAAVCYSGLFFWLGWRKFATLQLRHFSAGEGGALSSHSRSPTFGFGSFLAERLRCRPKGVSLNLVRKELRLQKPVFMIAGVMTVGWLLTLVLLWLQPGRKELYDAIFVGLTALYMALVTLLAACVPLGEERALGLASWQITLPVSARHHWLVRLGTALSVWAGLGFLLPFLLAWIASLKTYVGLFYLLQEKGNELIVLFIAAGILFVFSFWAITLVSNTIRAVLTALVMLPLLGLIETLAFWFSASVFDGVERGLLGALSSTGFLPVDWVGRPEFIFFFSLFVLAMAALTESFVLFRRPETTRNSILKSIGGLAAVALIVGLWCGDLVASAQRLNIVPYGFFTTPKNV